MNNNNFFAEFIARLGKSNPKFFDYIQIAAAIVGVISIAFKFFDDKGTMLPLWLQWIKSTTVEISSIVALVIAQLPNKDVNSNTK